MRCQRGALLPRAPESSLSNQSSSRLASALGLESHRVVHPKRDSACILVDGSYAFAKRAAAVISLDTMWGEDVAL